MSEKESVVIDEQGVELIEVVQLPVIEERLRSIKAQIETTVSDALAMECTEENLTAVKKKRAELRKAFDELEQRRKLVKEQVMAPYMAFEEVYRECVTEVFAPGDKKLKEAIDNIENGIKQAKADKAKAWFDEYKTSLGIDFLTWEQVGISVTKSVSLKKLNEQSKACLDRVRDELEMIRTQEYSDEILAEYKANGCNVAGAVTSVSRRHEAIEQERKRREAETQARERKEAAEAENLAAIEETLLEEQERQMAPDGLQMPEVMTVPDEEQFTNTEDSPEEPEDNRVYKLAFTVWGTLDKLRELKQFLTEGGYRYE